MGITENLFNIKKRQSNFELLRILLMFFVLVEHADFHVLGIPTKEDVLGSPESAITRIFFEFMSVGAVNCFIMISGWFGINMKFRSFSKFLYQIFFFFITIYVFLIILGEEFNIREDIKPLLLFKGGWFVKSYLILLCLSPALNYFIEHAPRNKQKHVLISFFFFQTIYGWLSPDTGFFNEGYTPISFVGLYLLARYLRTSRPAFSRYDIGKDLIIIMSIVILQSLLSFLSILGGHDVTFKMISYTNPLVIITSLYLIFFFSKLKFSNKFVNFIGASSFAVFLFHCHPNIYFNYFSVFVKQLYESYDSIICILMIGFFLILIYVLSITIDLTRMLSYEYIERIISKYNKIEFYHKKIKR